MIDFFDNNFQRFSNNRFVVDSNRFWKKEFHPRFNDLYNETDFFTIANLVNNELSLKIELQKITTLAKYLFIYFTGFRFAYIPKNNPYAREQFLSELYFVLKDILTQINFRDYPIIEDDFNIVTNRAETGKQDTSKVATNENNKQNTKNDTVNDILTNHLQSQTDLNGVVNVDEETKQNIKVINDTFLSPQNVGVTPVTNNPAGSGVDGINISNSGAFTTNTNNTNSGDTQKSKNNTSNNQQQATNELTQNNDIKLSQSIDNGLEQGQTQENATSKNDLYIETLDYNKVDRLQGFYNLTSNRLFLEIINRLSHWILQVDIATSNNNYVDYPTFE